MNIALRVLILTSKWSMTSMRWMKIETPSTSPFRLGRKIEGKGEWGGVAWWINVLYSIRFWLLFMCSGVHVIQFGRMLINFFFPYDFPLLQHGNFCEEKKVDQRIMYGREDLRGSGVPVCIASSSNLWGTRKTPSFFKYWAGIVDNCLFISDWMCGY